MIECLLPRLVWCYLECLIYDGSCHQTSFLSLRGYSFGAVIGLGGMLNVFISPNGSTKMGKMKMQVGGLFLMFLA